ncbi:MAG: hypothetical protein HY690_08215 [Chloroflexi bacterium]|nr:hypothetical protein [Chloroflexota bacterium]
MVTLRFRPVLFGPPAHPTAVYPLMEESDGQVYFWIPESAWPVAAALDAATGQDLPAPYRREEAEATLLPVQTVTGDTDHEAFQRMLAAIEALAHTGIPSARRQSAASAGRRRP